MRVRSTLVWTLALAVVLLSAQAPAQSTRRLTTIDALRQFPGYFHLQSVLLRGEVGEGAGGLVLRAGDGEMRITLADDVGSESGLVEVRGQLFDVGRLEATDPRLVPLSVSPDPERWPKPGEELLVYVTGLTPVDPPASPTIRTLALEPWRYVGQTVSVVGQFRGRNILGDLPASPASGRYDFVLRAADGALWVTGLRPRGRGFELAVNARVDTGRWVRVTGTVAHERGLVTIAGTAIEEAEAAAGPEIPEAVPEPDPLRLPLEVVFNSPVEAESGVRADAPVRVQFSRGANPDTLEGQIRVSYVDAEPGTPGPEFRQSYDAGTRALEIQFAQPLEPRRTVRIQLLEGIKAFDGAPFAPWTLTFTVGD